MTRTRSITAALVAVIAAAVLSRCGGGSSWPAAPSSSSTSTTPTTPSAAQGWRYSSEGVRVVDAGGPAALQVDAITYLFTNNGKQAPQSW